MSILGSWEFYPGSRSIRLEGTPGTLLYYTVHAGRQRSDLESPDRLCIRSLSDRQESLLNFMPFILLVGFLDCFDSVFVVYLSVISALLSIFADD